MSAHDKDAKRNDMFIGGAFVPSNCGRYFPVLNPANEEVIAEVAEGDAGDVERAIAAAQNGFKAWSQMSSYRRSRIIWDMARALEAHAEEFAELECRNQGKPIRHVKGFDIPNAVETFDYYAGMTTKLQGSTIYTAPVMYNYIVREPYGVVGSDHSLELSHHDGRVEDCTRTGSGKRGRYQTGALHAIDLDLAALRGLGARCRLAGWRTKRRNGHGTGRWTRHHKASTDRQDRVYGEQRDRTRGGGKRQ